MLNTTGYITEESSKEVDLFCFQFHPLLTDWGLFLQVSLWKSCRILTIDMNLAFVFLILSKKSSFAYLQVFGGSFSFFLLLKPEQVNEESLSGGGLFVFLIIDHWDTGRPGQIIQIMSFSWIISVSTTVYLDLNISHDEEPTLTLCNFSQMSYTLAVENVTYF